MTKEQNLTRIVLPKLIKMDAKQAGIATVARNYNKV
jgi:hypothetical protein